MSTAQVTIERDVIDRRIPMGRLRDTSAVIKRNLLQYIRVPQLLVFSTVQPIIFVLMFRFVFGGSINTGKIPYVDYLMPGIFLQVVVFGSLATAIGLATDLKSGLMERFHALPMWTPAVLVGRTLADLVAELLRRDPHDGRGVPGRAGGSTPPCSRWSPACSWCCCSATRCRGSSRRSDSR